ncbi:hypothetical protein BDN71DRAFT_1455012 [Pleurotus eryngii]|uniref:Uncharacterized protein n=1 Tax=Pleurotus eryngii TaxID=5323 RepID=A0A9P5ZMG8_PLEER|nr:hypothetical protein BDN71DRAFT_1455012 [Pleurotus eryngii]
MVHMSGAEVKPAQQWGEEPRSKVETGREPDLEIEKDQHCFVHRIPMFSSPPPAPCPLPYFLSLSTTFALLDSTTNR